MLKGNYLICQEKSFTSINKRIFLLDKTYFTGSDGYQFFLAFSLMVNSLTLNDNIKK